MARIVGVLLCAMLLNPGKSFTQLHLAEKRDSAGKSNFLPPLPRNFYTQRLGFFCQKEIQMQKALALPLFLRLGSKDYVDYMENKSARPGQATRAF